MSPADGYYYFMRKKLPAGEQPAWVHRMKLVNGKNTESVIRRFALDRNWSEIRRTIIVMEKDGCKIGEIRSYGSGKYVDVTARHYYSTTKFESYDHLNTWQDSWQRLTPGEVNRIVQWVLDGNDEWKNYF